MEPRWLETPKGAARELVVSLGHHLQPDDVVTWHSDDPKPGCPEFCIAHIEGVRFCETPKHHTIIRNLADPDLCGEGE